MTNVRPDTLKRIEFKKKIDDANKAKTARITIFNTVKHVLKGHLRDKQNMFS